MSSQTPAIQQLYLQASCLFVMCESSSICVIEGPELLTLQLCKLSGAVCVQHLLILRWKPGIISRGNICGNASSNYCR